MLFLAEITCGAKFRCYAIKSETQAPCHDFLTTAESEMPSELAKLLARIQRAADHGPPRNEEQCRQLNGRTPEETVYEFKTHKLRLLWFYDQDRVLLCTNGLVKGTRKEQDQAIAVARRWKRDYLAAKQRGEIKTLPPT